MALNIESFEYYNIQWQLSEAFKRLKVEIVSFSKPGKEPERASQSNRYSKWVLPLNTETLFSLVLHNNTISC